MGEGGRLVSSAEEGFLAWVSKLEEWKMKGGIERSVEYEKTGWEGPPHARTHRGKVVVEGEVLAEAEGSVWKDVKHESVSYLFVVLKRRADRLFLRMSCRLARRALIALGVRLCLIYSSLELYAKTISPSLNTGARRAADASCPSSDPGEPLRYPRAISTRPSPLFETQSFSSSIL
jgi:hypothetical protein